MSQNYILKNIQEKLNMVQIPHYLYLHAYVFEDRAATLKVLYFLSLIAEFEPDPQTVNYF